MSDVVLSKSTLIPLSCIGVIVAVSFWLSGMFKDVQAQGSEINRIRSERTSLEAEIIQRMASQNITMNQIQIKTTELDTKLTILLKWIEADRKAKD